MNTQELPSVTIIVLNYNGKTYADNCLDSLSKINYPKEKFAVIFYDNGSIDGSVAYVKDKFPWVNTIASKVNFGFTGGNNRAVEHANGDFVVFLNNDVVVDSNWLIELVKVAMDNPLAIVTSKSLFLNKPDIVDHAGTKATYVGRCFCIGFGKENDDSDRTPKYVPQPYGASMLISRSIFLKLGAFDETYFSSLEDTDIGLRAWLYGYKVIYVPTSVFYHVGGGTGGWGGQISSTMLFHVTKNSYMNIIKYFDTGHLPNGLTFALFYDLFTSKGLIRAKRVDLLKSILKAYAWVLKNLSVLVSKRRAIVSHQVVPFSFVFESSLFSGLSEMLIESSRIQSFYETYYA